MERLVTLSTIAAQYGAGGNDNAAVTVICKVLRANIDNAVKTRRIHDVATAGDHDE